VKALLELKPLQQFKQEGYPEFNSEALRDVTWAMLKAKEDTVRSVVKELGSMSKSDFPKEAQYIVDILPRLNEQYGEQDNGTLVALICMNFLTMDAGDALFVPADGIHAYLSGDIVECMARSNNVLNTGFCPAPDRDDIDLFAKTLTFKSVSKDEMILPSEKTDKSKNGKTRQYTPALSEFNMLVTSLEKGDTEEVKSVAGPSTLIVTSGKGVMKVGSEKYDLGEGCIYFIGQGIDVSFESDEGLVAYRAYAE
jgi:mannose-6-phosphate isomerase